MSDQEPQWHAVCRSDELAEGGLACPFDVVYDGQTCRAFVVRFEGQVRAYLNRCSHVAMEMDWQPNQFFDDQGLYLVCASHGAMFCPHSGDCVAGPARGPLTKIEAMEADGVVHWRSDYHVQPVKF